MTNLFDFDIILMSGGETVIQTTIRVTDELYEKVKRMANKRGVTVNGLIINILWDYFSEQIEQTE